jgi:hypothetical protein
MYISALCVSIFPCVLTKLHQEDSQAASQSFSVQTNAVLLAGYISSEIPPLCSVVLSSTLYIFAPAKVCKNLKVSLRYGGKLTPPSSYPLIKHTYSLTTTQQLRSSYSKFLVFSTLCEMANQSKMSPSSTIGTDDYYMDVLRFIEKKIGFECDEADIREIDMEAQ